jgi:hypothetical protein
MCCSFSFADPRCMVTTNVAEGSNLTVVAVDYDHLQSASELLQLHHEREIGRRFVGR